MKYKHTISFNVLNVAVNFYLESKSKEDVLKQGEKYMLKELGIMGLFGVIIFLILLPLIVTVVIGIAFANKLGFNGLTWWCFVILFYLVVTACLSRVSKG